MRMPGVEPGSQAWEACMMPLHYMRHDIMINLLGRILEDHYSCESLDGSADAPAGAASSRLLVRVFRQWQAGLLRCIPVHPQTPTNASG